MDKSILHLLPDRDGRWLVLEGVRGHHRVFHSEQSGKKHVMHVGQLIAARGAQAEIHHHHLDGTVGIEYLYVAF